MDDGFRVPLFYVMNRKLPEDEAAAVLRALSITPCQAAIVTDLLDTKLAFSVAPDVIHAINDEQALLLARKVVEEIRRPVLVIGVADFLDAVYSDGTREAVAKVA